LRSFLSEQIKKKIEKKHNQAIQKFKLINEKIPAFGSLLPQIIS
jgi:hypothetical protein